MEFIRLGEFRGLGECLVEFKRLVRDRMELIRVGKHRM